MKTLRNTLSSTTIPRTGTLIVTQKVDLEALRKEHGESIPVEALEATCAVEIALEKAGSKTRHLARYGDVGSAEAYVAGFKACADIRRAANKKAAKGAKRAAEAK